MTEEEQKLILDMTLERISKDQFLERYSSRFIDDPGFLREELQDARSRGDSGQLECVLILLSRFGGADKHALVIGQFLLEGWHEQHENIALLLKELKDPRTAGCLYEGALAAWPYLDFDDAYALAVKCVWALGAIDSTQAKAYLELLATSNNSVVRENAQRQLARKMRGPNPA